MRGIRTLRAACALLALLVLLPGMGLAELAEDFVVDPGAGDAGVLGGGSILDGGGSVLDSGSDLDGGGAASDGGGSGSDGGGSGSDGGAGSGGAVSGGAVMPDITALATVKVTARQSNVRKMLDGSYRSYYESGSVSNPAVKVMMEGGPKAHGVYIRFSKMPPAFDVMELNADDTWTTVWQSEDKPPFLHVYVPLTGADTFRVRARGKKQTSIAISELTVLGEGDVPGWVQRWQPTLPKAELMVISAHADDEVLYMGGTIPYYAGQLQKDVIVVYMTFSDRVRRSELLDCLWECGVRTYPVIGSFGDKYSEKLSTAYKDWGGKKAVQKWMTALFRQYKPEVVVTHDTKGEYGHGAHKATSAAARDAFTLAADEKQFPDSAKKYGVWQVKKLYLHLYPENKIEMDWDQPLSAFGGRTAFEMAVAGYQHHASQHRYGFIVEARDSRYSCYRFGLAESVVGADVRKDCFLENVGAGR